MSTLSVAKQILIDRTTHVYNDMREGLDLSEYKSHYESMGEFICYIDKFTSFGDICNDLISGNFSQIMLFGEDEDLEEFLKEVLNAIK